MGYLLHSILIIVCGRVPRHTLPWGLEWTVVQHNLVGWVTTSHCKVGHKKCHRHVAWNMSSILKFTKGGLVVLLPCNKMDHLGIPVPAQSLLSQWWDFPLAFSHSRWVNCEIAPLDIGLVQWTSLQACYPTLSQGLRWVHPTLSWLWACLLLKSLKCVLH